MIRELLSIALAALAGWAFAEAVRDTVSGPLSLPRVRALDLRPAWLQHPHLDMLRRGERDWESGLELAAARSPYGGYLPALPMMVYGPRWPRPRMARLRLPLTAKLDLRPRWERHPHLGMYRRGERDWRSASELVTSGWRRIRLTPKVEYVFISVAVTPPRCAYDFTHPRGMTEDEARRQMGLPPVS